jgi:hypothetical protein
MAEALRRLTRLTVRKDGAIKSSKRFIQQWRSTFGVHPLLGSYVVVHVIEYKLVLGSLRGMGQHDFAVPQFVTRRISCRDFRAIHGTASHRDLHI